ncbi:MAG: phosphatidylserine decarboxylase [Alphaproteobacteria bacterium]|nr:phosphatidylserine decarboxylase [Alphaproteobacteria bacterium]OJV15776.1 MAG: phosphatidylserine decarboxylase [Alphaproteobacteria bacterium 33-17]
MKKFIHPIHPEGYPFVLIFAIVTVVLALISSGLGIIGAVATIWCTYFFRDPPRQSPCDDSLIISPADGLVDKIAFALPPEELGMPAEEMLRVSVFLSVFNVHVNRVPASGTITALHYRPGKFLNATLDKASVDNERQSVRMTTKYKNLDIAFTQIAGLIARRIVCNLEHNQEVKGGERFGIIRFGSRMDIYLPKDTKVCVAEGQITIGGETVIADLETTKAEFKAEIR